VKKRLGIVIALIALNLFVYSDVGHFDFVNWDDQSYLTENTNVQAGLSWSNVRWALTTSHSPYWHPLTWMSHMLDVTLYGMDPGPHHVTSLIIHVASTLLLFFIFQRMTRATGASAFVAAIFAVHPLHVESVAWLAERKDVLSTFFLFVTMWAYVRYVERPGWRRYVIVIAAYVLALMSKPMVVTLPFVLLLLDVWPLGRIRNWRPAVLEKIPLVALALGTSVATFVVQKQVGAVAGLGVLPLRTRVANALVGYVTYVWKTIWPTHLAAFYPFRTQPEWQVWMAAATLIAVTVVVIKLRVRYPYLFVGWLWYVITVAPVIGLMQAGEQARADRFMYVPMIGLLVIAAWTRWPRTGIGTRGSWLMGALIVAACAVTAHAQVEHWSDSVALWQHAARVTEGNYIAYENTGQALRERGQLEEAKANYEAALRLAPGHSPGYEAIIHNSLGLVLVRQGRPDEALPHFAQAVRLSPAFAEAHSNYANGLAADGRFADAVVHYRAALASKPDFTEALVGLGGALLREGRAQEAAVQYREALRLDPRLAQAHNGLGGALSLEHHDDDAMAEFSRALELKPDLPSAHLNIAILLLRRNDVAGARRQLETALSIDPSYEPARNALAQLR
jgi:Tfp pilus assembly protein PilF